MKNLAKIQKIVFIFLLIFVAVFLLSFVAKGRYPAPKEALSLLKNDPVQTATDAQKFSVKDGNVEYEITPLYNYELYGMIVSSGDNLSWFSRFKDKDPLNTNDFCVIWGSNIETGIYQHMNFKNQEFVCIGSFNEDGKDFSQFTNDHLSNNHLLADSKTSKAIYNEIRAAKAGDQIHFKGYLVSYSTKKDGVLLGSRGSSTTREDSGDGACETVYVTNFEIIKAYDTPMVTTNRISKDFMTYGGIVWIILVLIGWAVPNKYQREDEIPVGKIDNFEETLPTNITKK